MKEFSMLAQLSSFRVDNRVLTNLLAKCRPYLVHLNLRGCYRITEFAFMNIRQCRNLQDLNMSGLDMVNVGTTCVSYLVLNVQLP